MADRVTNRVATGKKRDKKTRLLAMSDLDMRLGSAKWAKATQQAIESDLGGRAGLSTLETITAENTALLAAVMRDAGVRWLRGDSVPAGELATLANALVRLTTQLGLSKRVIDVNADLNAYLESTNVEPEQKNVEPEQQKDEPDDVPS